MEKKFFLFTLLIFLVLGFIFAEDTEVSPAIELGGEIKYNGAVSGTEFFDFSYLTPTFSFVLGSSLHSDGLYAPSSANLPGGTLMGTYFLMDRGGIFYNLGNLSLRAGRLHHEDILETPYSLFVSSNQLAANIGEIHYETDRYIYESRWVELNNSSSQTTTAFPDGYPNRGANIKVYALKFANMRFGYQDAAIYVDRNFDPEYFLNPLPSYIIQYVKGIAGRPWATSSEDNSIMGVFWDWQYDESLYLESQFLMDDLSMPFIPNTPDNPWKAAWNMGARMETDLGSFGFYHAGAFKYTFEPTYSEPGALYGYAYYPDTRFNIGTEEVAIPFDTLMLGYKHGENNLAFQVDYKNNFSKLGFYSALEFVIAGSNSPANPWQDLVWHENEGTKLLDEAVLEKSIILSTSLSYPMGKWLAFGTVDFGYIFNQLELVQTIFSGDTLRDPLNDDLYLYKPSDTNALVFKFSFGMKYTFDRISFE